MSSSTAPSHDVAADGGDPSAGLSGLVKRVFDNGFAPTVLVPREKRPINGGWRSSGIDELLALARRYPDAGVGLRTGGGLLAIDADTDDPGLARIVADVIVELCGDDVPTRYRDDSERRAYLLRREGHHPKHVLALERKDITQKLELFNEGSQIVMSGMHPDGAQIKWLNGSPRTVPRDELTLIDEDGLAELLRLVIERAAAEGWEVVNGGAVLGSSSAPTPSEGDSDPNMLSVRDCPSFSIETHSVVEVRCLLKAQDPNASRPVWFPVIAAIAHWDSSKEIGEDLAREFSRGDLHPKVTVKYSQDKAEKDIEGIFDHVRQGQWEGRPSTLASLIRDRKVYDAEEARRDEEAREIRESGILAGYRLRIIGASDEATLIEIKRCLRTDKGLRNVARVRMAELLCKQYKSNNLGSPPLDSIRRDVINESEEGGEPDAGKRDPRRLVVDAVDATADLYVNQYGEAFADMADLTVSSNLVTMPVEGSAFADHLLGEGMRLGGMFSDRDAATIARNIAVLAKKTGTVRTTAMRVAQVVGDDPTGAKDRIFIDHVDNVGTVTEITADGVRSVTLDKTDGVRFVRGDSPAPLPALGNAPEDLAAAMAEFWTFIPIAKAHRTLVLSTMLGWLCPAGDKPILVLTGPAGSGKSTVLEFIRALVDPQTGGLAGKPRNKDDAPALLAANYATAIDNPTSFSPDVEDLFCRGATGGADVGRRLYANHGTVARDIGGPIMVAAIEQPLRASDALARTITGLVVLEGQRDKVRVRRDFEAARPALLATLYALLSACLRELPHVEIRTEAKDGHRFVGLERIGEAVHRVLGIDGTFAAVLDADGRAAREAALQGHPVLISLVDMVVSYRGEPLVGTAASILKRVTVYAGRQPARHSDEWPETAQKFGMLVRRYEKALADAGVTIENLPRRRGYSQEIRLSVNANARDWKDVAREDVLELPDLSELDEGDGATQNGRDAMH